MVAAGAWTPTLLKGIGTRIPIIAGKGYALDFSPPPVVVRHPLYLHDLRVAASPYPGRVRLSGTMELTGLDMHTIAKGRSELIERDVHLERIRRPGAGRPALEKKPRNSSPRSKS